MPHIWIEYSANLKDCIESTQLVEALHLAVIDSGMFPTGGIRTRAHTVADYRIADGHPDNGFVHVIVRIAHGRDLQTRKKIGELLHAILCSRLADLFSKTPLGLSLEIQELDPALNFKLNNLQEYVERRKGQQPAENS